MMESDDRILTHGTTFSDSKLDTGPPFTVEINWTFSEGEDEPTKWYHKIFIPYFYLRHGHKQWDYDDIGYGNYHHCVFLVTGKFFIKKRKFIVKKIHEHTESITTIMKSNYES